MAKYMKTNTLQYWSKHQTSTSTTPPPPKKNVNKQKMRNKYKNWNGTMFWAYIIDSKINDPLKVENAINSDAENY